MQKQNEMIFTIRAFLRAPSVFINDPEFITAIIAARNKLQNTEKNLQQEFDQYLFAQISKSDLLPLEPQYLDTCAREFYLFFIKNSTIINTPLHAKMMLILASTFFDFVSNLNHIDIFFVLGTYKYVVQLYFEDNKISQAISLLNHALLIHERAFKAGIINEMSNNQFNIPILIDYLNTCQASLQQNISSIINENSRKSKKISQKRLHSDLDNTVSIPQKKRTPIQKSSAKKSMSASSSVPQNTGIPNHRLLQNVQYPDTTTSRQPILSSNRNSQFHFAADISAPNCSSPSLCSTSEESDHESSLQPSSA